MKSHKLKVHSISEGAREQFQLAQRLAIAETQRKVVWGYFLSNI